MLDVDLLVTTLKNFGHTVGHVNSIPENAGSYEFEVDGKLITLAEVRALLDDEAAKREGRA